MQADNSGGRGKGNWKGDETGACALYSIFMHSETASPPPVWLEENELGVES